MDNNQNVTNPFVNKLETDEYEILYSGSTMLFKPNGNIKFYIDDLIIELQFIKGNFDDKISIDRTNSTDKHIIIKCTGYENSLGTGLTKPINILDIDNVPVFFRFIAFDMSNLPYIVFSFYREIKK